MSLITSTATIWGYNGREGEVSMLVSTINSGVDPEAAKQMIDHFAETAKWMIDNGQMFAMRLVRQSITDPVSSDQRSGPPIDFIYRGDQIFGLTLTKTVPITEGMEKALDLASWRPRVRKANELLTATDQPAIVEAKE
jgi:hypothetical protein